MTRDAKETPVDTLAAPAEWYVLVRPDRVLRGLGLLCSLGSARQVLRALWTRPRRVLRLRGPQAAR